MPAPALSIILPTFNRERFLPEAFEAIRSQIFTDWELIVVDDGSTDNTEAMVRRASETLTQPLVYVRQENRGAYGARNTGLAHASGPLVAFYDSDDLWLPHHLSRCVAAFAQHPQLDWVYGSCRRVEHATGRVLNENSFYLQGRPRPFLDARTRMSGDLHIVDDPRCVEIQLVHGFYCGLQNSVIRRSLFAEDRFTERFRVVEDELFVVRALAGGAQVAYYLAPHVVYRVHDTNSSASSSAQRDEKMLGIFHELVEGLEGLDLQVQFTPRQKRALGRRLSNEYFWHLGYHGLWKAGRRREALAAYRRGMSLRPFDVRMWKSYLAALARTRVHPTPAELT